MHRPALSADEIELLKNHFQRSPIALIRLKAQTILMRHQGLKEETIAELVVRDVRSIQRYLSDFAKRRLASLFSGHRDNENAGKLTREQKREIVQVLRRPPEGGGLPKAFWDVPTLKEYVRAEFGVIYESDQSYHYLLKFSGLSFKYPERVSPRRDELQIAKRLSRVRAEINPLLKDPRWSVFTADETRIQLEAEIRRAWLKKGQPTAIQTEKSREHQNYLGFLDQKTGDCLVYETERGNQGETVRVLRKLLKRNRGQRVCVVWDNARWHRGKILRKELFRGRSLAKLHLVSLPPYAPETNPTEHVWQYAKKQIANRHQGNFETTKRRFLKTIRSRKFSYQI